MRRSTGTRSVFTWMHGFVLVCMYKSRCASLKHCVVVFEARGSSCCVLSCFPAAVSTWLRVGCQPETPRPPASRLVRLVPSARFGSSGCSWWPGCLSCSDSVGLSGYSGSVFAQHPSKLQPEATVCCVGGWLAASERWGPKLWAATGSLKCQRSLFCPDCSR